MTVYGPRNGKNGQKRSYFGFIWTSGDGIDVISKQQLNNVVFHRLHYPNGGRCAQIWHKSPKPRQNWVAAGRRSRSRQFLDCSVTGFRYLIKSYVGGGLCAVLPGGAARGPRGARSCPTSVRPSAFPGQATKRVSLASLWSWAVWPPYCSHSCSRVIRGRGPCVVLVRWRGFACLSQPLWEQAGGVCGGAWRTGSAAPPSRAPRPFRGEAGRPLCLGGGGGPAPPWPVGRRGGVRGEGRGGRAVVPHLPPPGGWPVAPGPDPPSSPAHPPQGILSRQGSFGSPGRRARPGLLPVGQSGGGGRGGWLVRRPPSGARPGGPAGRGAGRSPCHGLFLRLPWAGTKAGTCPGAAVPLRPTGRI